MPTAVAKKPAVRSKRVAVMSMVLPKMCKQLDRMADREGRTRSKMIEVILQRAINDKTNEVSAP
jgi:metal-responsive CopG/Arc/MetJ family transcriptional regulator